MIFLPWRACWLVAQLMSDWTSGHALPPVVALAKQTITHRTSANGYKKKKKNVVACTYWKRMAAHEG